MAGVDTCTQEGFLIVSEPLCYLKCKFKKLNIKTLKSVVHDFYRADEITAAKELMVQTVEKLALDKVIRPPKRKSGENKIRLEVDDLISLFQSVDENLALDKLPHFVAKNVDNIPSSNIENGDLRSIINRLDAMDNNHKVNIEIIKLDVASTADLIKEQQKSLKNIQAQFDLSIPSFVGKKTAIWGNKQKVNNIFRNNSESDVRSAMEEGDSVQNAVFVDKGDSFTQVVSRGKQKRRRLTLSQEDSTSIAPVTKFVPKSFVGTNNHCTLKAAKTLKKKKVYLLGNVSTDEKIEDVSDWMKQLNIEVVSIFDVKTKFQNTQSFRVCIDAASDDIFTNMDNWPNDVIIRQWVHKEKKDKMTGNTGAENIVK